MATVNSGFITNFDFEAFEKWAYDKGITPTSVSLDMGYNDGYMANSKNRNTLRKSAYKLLCKLYDLPDDSFLKKELLAVVEKTVEVNTVDNAEVLRKLEDMQLSVNRLGNCLMQILEYVGDIRKELK